MSPVEIGLRLTPDRALEFATLLLATTIFEVGSQPLRRRFWRSSTSRSPHPTNAPSRSTCRPSTSSKRRLSTSSKQAPFGQGGQHEGDRLSYWPFFIFVAT